MVLLYPTVQGPLGDSDLPGGELTVATVFFQGFDNHLQI